VTKAEAAFGAHCGSQREAMLGADVGHLEELLADRFTLTHITGYVQTKRKWLDDIKTGQMRYHSIDDLELAVDLSVPMVTVRTLADATIWGSRAVWRLQLRIFLESDAKGVFGSGYLAGPGSCRWCRSTRRSLRNPTSYEVDRVTLLAQSSPPELGDTVLCSVKLTTRLVTEGFPAS
jgi:Domain of unknown function (DUF4440)